MDRVKLFFECLNRPVVFSSAECTQGSVFFALPGAKVHGHQYLKQAKELGAEIAVIEESYNGDTYGLDCVRVEKTLDTLQAIAAQVVREFKFHIVGITGSCGKTTTKDFTTSMLRHKYDVEKSPGTRNSQVGLPTAIINMRKDAELYVFEMGMSMPGELTKLVQIAPPEVAAITMIARAHLEFFGSTEAIAKAKGEIFSSELLKKGFVGEGASMFPFLTNGHEIVKHAHFPEHDDLPEHFHDDASIALAIAEYYGVDRQSALSSLEKPSDARRFNLKEIDGVFWLSDSYNCIPEALAAALKNLPQKGERNVALLSEMKELGEQAAAIHEELAQEAAAHLDLLVCYGEHMKKFETAFLRDGKEVLWFPTREEAADALQRVVRSGDLVLVKGANSQKLWELIPCYS